MKKLLLLVAFATSFSHSAVSIDTNSTASITPLYNIFLVKMDKKPTSLFAQYQQLMKKD